MSHAEPFLLTGYSSPSSCPPCVYYLVILGGSNPEHHTYQASTLLPSSHTPNLCVSVRFMCMCVCVCECTWGSEKDIGCSNPMGSLVCIPHRAGVTEYAHPHWGFYMGAGDLDSDPQTCIAIALNHLHSPFLCLDPQLLFPEKLR